MMAGAPNRPLPPTPDEDANERTLIMKRVSDWFFLSSAGGWALQVSFRLFFYGGMPFSCRLKSLEKEVIPLSFGGASVFVRVSLFYNFV